MSGIAEGWVGWPAPVAAEYRRRGWWAGRRLESVIAERARRDPDATAVADPAGRWSNVRLADAVERRAAGFAGHGLAAGDRVIVQLPNDAEFLVTFLGLLRLGVAPVLALPALRTAELVHLAETTDAVGYVAPAAHLGTDYGVLAAELCARCPGVRQVFLAGGDGDRGTTSLADVDAAPLDLPARGADEIAFFLLSGGTTGLPKVIARTHDDYLHNLRHSAAAAGLRPDEIFLAVLSVCHNFTLGCPGVLGALWTGGSIVLGGPRSPDECADLLDPHGVTYTAVTPPTVAGWLDRVAEQGITAPALRTVQVGAAKLTPRLADRIRAELGAAVQQSFGMSEGLLLQTTADDPHGIARETQGVPVSPGDEIRLVDANDLDVPDETEGHLLVCGPYTIRGYYRAPDHDRSAFTDDGYYRSGDLAVRRPDGRYVVTGRAKDVVNRGGEIVSAAELEEHLRRHPAVRDAAVVAIPDERLGERTCAVIVPEADAPDPRLPVLRRHLRERGVAPFKWPDAVRLVPDLPRTALGKTDKTALRAGLAPSRRTQGDPCSGTGPTT